jgi:hypothetical protein
MAGAPPHMLPHYFRHSRYGQAPLSETRGIADMGAGLRAAHSTTQA